MRWLRVLPADGTIRKKLVFAIVPQLSTDGYWYWLEYVWKVQTYDRSFEKWFTIEHKSARPE